MRYIEREVATPLCAISERSSLENKTGSWRFAVPMFIDRASPCNRQCPAGEDIAGTMFLAAQERFEDAWRLIMGENPFPSIMGRVCYHTCEKSCNRLEHDEAVSIHSVERFLGDYALEEKLEIGDLPEIHGGRIAVVGAGPAGLSAAYHLRRMGHGVVVYDSRDKPGGLMQYGIPTYRLPREIVEAEVGRLEPMGIGFRMGCTLGRDMGWDELAADNDAVFLAVGAHRETRLDLDGEDLKGVFTALSFLENVNNGFFPEIGRNVIVIGGGNSAIDCARICRRLGASVMVAYRRSEGEMPAHPEEVKLAREEGVKFEFLCAPDEVLGDERVTGMNLAKMELADPDDSGRRRPVPTGDGLQFDCDCVLFAVGGTPDFSNLPGNLADDEKGIPADEFGRTRLDKVFIGGDLAPIPRTVTHAIGSGKRAALAISDFLTGGNTVESAFRWGDTGNVFCGDLCDYKLFPRRNPSDEVAGYTGLNTFYFDRRPVLRTKRLPIEVRINGFFEDTEGPSQGEAVLEASRCFNCGSCTGCGNCYVFCPDLSIQKDAEGFGYAVSLDYCKGCGICVQECPRGAMKMVFGTST